MPNGKVKAYVLYTASYDGDKFVISKVAHYIGETPSSLSWTAGNKLKYTGRVASRSPLTLYRNKKGGAEGNTEVVAAETILTPETITHLAHPPSN